MDLFLLQAFFAAVVASLALSLAAFAFNLIGVLRGQSSPVDRGVDLALSLGMTYMSGAMAGLIPASVPSGVFASGYSVLAFGILARYLAANDRRTLWRDNSLDMFLRTVATAFMFLPPKREYIVLTLVFVAYHAPCIVSSARAVLAGSSRTDRLSNADSFSSGVAMVLMLTTMQVMPFTFLSVICGPGFPGPTR